MSISNGISSELLRSYVRLCCFPKKHELAFCVAKISQIVAQMRLMLTILAEPMSSMCSVKSLPLVERGRRLGISFLRNVSTCGPEAWVLAEMDEQSAILRSGH